MADFLMRHGSGYKYVRAVPKDLRDVAGQSFWTRYIGAVPHEEAKARALLHAARDQQIIDGLKRLLPSERNAIAEAGGVNAWRKAHAFDAPSVPWLQLGASLEPDPEQPDPMQAQDALFAVYARRELARIEEATATVRKITRKLNGQGGSLLALVDLHEKVAAPRSYKTGEKARLYVRRFIDVIGDMTPQDVTREHVIKFRDDLEAKGFTAHNVTQHLAKLHTLFNVALSEGVMQSNPAHKIKARKGNAKLSGGKQGFDAAQVKRIFNVLGDETADFQWIMKLLAYHGARGSEICQLRCADVTTLHSVPVLRIHDQHGRVKNRQSVRDIPIHPKCRGIITYAAKVAAKHGADAWLFSTLKESKQGRGHSFQNYANRVFLRVKVGIKERSYTVHSLRHAFSTACREAGMPDAAKYALMGHSLGKGEGGKYGEGPSLKLRAKWIAKIDPLKG